MGSYVLDDVKEYLPVYLPSSSEVYFFSLHLSWYVKQLVYGMRKVGVSNLFAYIDFAWFNFLILSCMFSENDQFILLYFLYIKYSLYLVV